MLATDGTAPTVAPDEAPLGAALCEVSRCRTSRCCWSRSPDSACRMVADGERLFDTDGALLGAIVVWRDITEQRDAEEQLAFPALHDTLTGLPNRALFIDRVRCALVRAPRYGWSTAVLAINLDHFRRPCDPASGTGSADKLLLEVAQRLEVTLRPYDSVSRPVDTLARLGGDRFLLMCEDIADAGGCEQRSQTVSRRSCASPSPSVTDVVRLSAAIGITLTRDPEHDPETLILEAETAMRRSRTRGSGAHQPFAPEMRAELRARCAGRGGAAAVRSRPRAVLRGVPAEGVAGHRAHRRRRGAPSLEASGAWTDLAARLHPARRGVRAHRADRCVGARPGVPGRHALAHRVAGWAAAHGRRERVAATVRVGTRGDVRRASSRPRESIPRPCASKSPRAWSCRMPSWRSRRCAS